MGKVNACLKRGYVIFTALIGVSGVMVIGSTLYAHGAFHFSEKFEEVVIGIYIYYAIGSILVLLAVTGIYGACKEAKWALILFTVVIGLASILIFLSSIMGLEGLSHSGNKDMEELEFLTVPLSQASDEDKERLNGIQEHLECCGVKQGYQDWGFDIPESCLCSGDSDPDNNCVSAPKNTSLYYKEESMIYKQPCLPLLLEEEKTITIMEIVMAMFLSYSLIWMTSVALCIAIIVQLYRRQVDVPTVLYSAEAKAGNYSCLVESAGGVVM